MKIHKDQLEMFGVGGSEHSVSALPSWSDKRLAYEISYLLQVCKAARADYGRMKTDEKYWIEASKTKSKKWERVKGDLYAVEVIKSNVRFLRHFTSNQHDRLVKLREMCKEATARGLDASTAIEFISVEGILR